MKSEREERKRAERARAREQMGSLLGRKPTAGAVMVGVCNCGARVTSPTEVLLCPEGHDVKAGR